MKKITSLILACLLVIVGTILAGTAPAGASVLNSCTYCHGFPPRDGVRKGNPHFTSQSSAFRGNHQTHSGANVSSCEKCHPGSRNYTFGHMTSAGKPVIKLGANLNSSTPPGQYVKATTAIVFTNQTTIPIMGSCSSVNCHFNSTSDAWGTAPYTSADTGTCGKCHGAPPASANHTKHFTVFGSTLSTCAKCHPDHAAETAKFQHATSASSGHRNLAVTFSSGSYGTGKTVYPNYLPGGSGAYSTCTNVYCHSNVQGTAGTGVPTGFTNQTWGSATPLTCAGCHADMSGTSGSGSHVLHASTTGNGQYACATCHLGYLPPTQTLNHANGSINLAFSTPSQLNAPMVQGTTYSKGSNFSAGAAYGSCVNTSCHGSGQPVWGANTARPSCEKCHGSAATVPFYATSGIMTSTDPKAGAHTNHLNSAAAGVGHNLSSNVACTECHTIPAGVNAFGHFTSAPLIVFGSLSKTGGLSPSYNQSTRACSNTYCHGVTLVGGASTAPTWNSPLLTGVAATDCGRCHGYPPLEGAHLPTKLPTECISCHPNVNPAGTGFINPALHINGSVEALTNCDSCHGYPPASTGFVGGVGNWPNARSENYPGGGGAHTISKHVSSFANPAAGFAYCDKCHSPADHVTNPVVFQPSANIKVRVNTNFAFEPAKQARYSSNRLDGNAHITGTCSNINCHFGATPKWDPLH